mmetsp:Transcript_68222/g.101368  ORF Transcript_68222/g.101368 Transcript_68222/m.101368 type:complete len:100 (+) Transcript_68222:104-403(+)
MDLHRHLYNIFSFNLNICCPLLYSLEWKSTSQSQIQLGLPAVLHEIGVFSKAWGIKKAITISYIQKYQSCFRFWQRVLSVLFLNKSNLANNSVNATLLF